MFPFVASCVYFYVCLSLVFRCVPLVVVIDVRVRCCPLLADCCSLTVACDALFGVDCMLCVFVGGVVGCCVCWVLSAL